MSVSSWMGEAVGSAWTATQITRRRSGCEGGGKEPDDEPPKKGGHTMIWIITTLLGLLVIACLLGIFGVI